ncbi:fructose-bisphosphate aldolase class 1 [bacterium BMS3Abin01]|nr:fructose-bisphosphate aldolase class 1 [bacterium BMS3Abin01]HDY69530.1 aldolase [Actinomycetota bacterium]
MIDRNNIRVPLDVPPAMRDEYLDNFILMTKGTGHLMLFAGDQKVEHMNSDFVGENELGTIPEDDADPEHMFRIASGSTIGVYATQMGMVSMYGADYPDVPYLVKLNSKTNLVKTKTVDPFSNLWLDVDRVAAMKQDSELKIPAVGYTIYLGSTFEAQMLEQAARLVNDAHRHGILVVLWIYPRGQSVADEKDPHLIAGATGVALTLGADFVKVNYPRAEGKESSEVFKEAVAAAGRTRVVCAGGSSTDSRAFLQRLHDQIHISGAQGNATGRNIHQKPLDEAVRMCNAISAITLADMSVDEAFEIYEGDRTLDLKVAEGRTP